MYKANEIQQCDKLEQRKKQQQTTTNSCHNDEIFPIPIMIKIFTYCIDRKARFGILNSNKLYLATFRNLYFDVDIIANRTNVPLNPKDFFRYKSIFCNDRDSLDELLQRSNLEISKGLLNHALLYFEDYESDPFFIYPAFAVYLPKSIDWSIANDKLGIIYAYIRECLPFFAPATCNMDPKKQEYCDHLKCSSVNQSGNSFIPWKSIFLQKQPWNDEKKDFDLYNDVTVVLYFAICEEIVKAIRIHCHIDYDYPINLEIVICLRAMLVDIEQRISTTTTTLAIDGTESTITDTDKLVQRTLIYIMLKIAMNLLMKDDEIALRRLWK